MKRANVSLSDELHKALRVFAAEHGTTVNDVLLRGVIKEIGWQASDKPEGRKRAERESTQQQVTA